MGEASGPDCCGILQQKEGKDSGEGGRLLAETKRLRIPGELEVMACGRDGEGTGYGYPARWLAGSKAEGAGVWVWLLLLFFM